MNTSVAVVTMVKDDLFFLRRWLDYYSGLFGRENLYVVNHGRGTAVAEMAAGCNVIGIPEGDTSNFDMIRWRLLNGLVHGLVCYHDHVIVGDVDELVVVDPATGQNLREWLSDQQQGQVLTPLCLEIVHDRHAETQEITDRILGPRRHFRTVLRYAKPSILSVGAKLSRGGHFSSFDRMIAPEPLYMIHLKYCDFGNYSRTLSARNEVAAQAGTGVLRTHIGRHWFKEFRGDDAEVFDQFAQLPVSDSFDFSALRSKMAATFVPRAKSGYFQFDFADTPNRHRLPDRFCGLF